MKSFIKKCTAGILLLALACALSGCGEKQKYEQAMDLYNAGDFREAAALFEELGEYEDSETLLQNCEYELTADRRFIRALSQGLHKRWILAGKQTEEAQTVTVEGQELTVGDEYSQEIYIKAELEGLLEFKTADFQDQQLQEKALEYIAALEKGIEAEKYAQVDAAKYYEMTDEVYVTRALLLSDFYNNYGMQVAENDVATMEDFLGSAEAVQEAQRQEEELKELFINHFSFTAEWDDYLSIEVHYEFENDSPYDINNLYLEVRYFTEDGKMTSDYTSLYVNSIKAGEFFSGESMLWGSDDNVSPTGMLKLTELSLSVGETQYSDAESWFE